MDASRPRPRPERRLSWLLDTEGLTSNTSARDEPCRKPRRRAERALLPSCAVSQSAEAARPLVAPEIRSGVTIDIGRRSVTSPPARRGLIDRLARVGPNRVTRQRSSAPPDAERVDDPASSRTSRVGVSGQCSVIFDLGNPRRAGGSLGAWLGPLLEVATRSRQPSLTRRCRTRPAREVPPGPPDIIRGAQRRARRRRCGKRPSLRRSCPRAHCPRPPEEVSLDGARLFDPVASRHTLERPRTARMHGSGA